jgi:hypothetical protein
MRVKAIATSGKNLSNKSLEALHSNDEEFQLNIGDIYTVYGINVWRGIVHYLTFDKWYNNPFWTPAELFEIVDNRLPPDWHFKFYGYEDKHMDLVNAVFGYKELALNPRHYFELINREGDSSLIFKTRKKEIDAFHNNLINEQIE